MIRQNSPLNRVLTNQPCRFSGSAAVAELAKLAFAGPVEAAGPSGRARPARAAGRPAVDLSRMLMDRQNVVRAEVITATPLTADETRAIERALAAVTGKTVSAATSVDADIVGESSRASAARCTTPASRQLKKSGNA
jgi:hypothetical protein